MSNKRKSSEKTDESDIAGNADSMMQEGGEPPSNNEEQAPAEEVQAPADQYLRLAAEFENYKKRAQKDQLEYIKYANERLLRDLLPVLDNLQRALEHAQQPGSTNGLVEGVGLTCKQYMETLSRFGVKPIPSVGLPFDPAVHQAVAMVDAKEGQEPNTIVAEHEKGYYLYDRVLRPAMVTVAASNKAAENQEQ
ncbi:MAG TPA: nucleotide exchange factor GrpE [Nitrospirales bacterium]